MRNLAARRSMMHSDVTQPPSKPFWFHSLLLKQRHEVYPMFARFSIVADVVTSTLRVSVGGFYELPDVARFTAAFIAERARLRCPPNQHRTLIDMREMKIQPQTSVEGFQQLMRNPAVASRRLAFVVDAGLPRAQAQRAANGRAAMYFRSVEEAEAWLLSDSPVLVGDLAMLPPLGTAMRVPA